MDTEESNRDYLGGDTDRQGEILRRGGMQRRVSAGAEQGKLGSAKRGRMDTEENREEPYILQGLSYFLPYL